MGTDRSSFFAKRWVRVTIGVSIGGLLLSGVGAWYLLSAGTHALSVDDAVQRFRGGPATPAAGPPTGTGSASPILTPGATAPSSTPKTGTGPSTKTGPGGTANPDPESGVYVYDTEGHDETDALTGSRHDYPSRTTYTTQRAGCHWVSRWQPIEERWDETEACKTSKGITLRRYSMYHEFFHKGVREDFTCDSDAVVMPWKQTPGDRWSFRCHSPGTALDMAVRLVGFETVRVGSRNVRAVHIHYEGKVTGMDEGIQTQDRWLEPRTGWFLRITSSSDVTTESPFGRVHYLESYRIDLTSLEPQR